MDKLNSKLPKKCMSVDLVEGNLIEIRLGEKGYYPLSLGHSLEGVKIYGVKNVDELADSMNAEAGIKKNQRSAMEWGAMFGWSNLAANPDRWDEDGNPIKRQLVNA